MIWEGGQLLPNPLVVDSGAGETVLPIGWFGDHPGHISEERLGELYTADGSRVSKQREDELLLSTADGQQQHRAMTF